MTVSARVPVAAPGKVKRTITTMNNASRSSRRSSWRMSRGTGAKAFGASLGSRNRIVASSRGCSFCL